VVVLPGNDERAPSMSSQPTCDVVVVGAGPAGAAAARLLASWGHSVAIVTRAPTNRALAESLPPSCTRLLDRLGATGLVQVLTRVGVGTG